MRTLAFFHSRGQRFHKYGAIPNVLLATGYALSLAYWHLQNSFPDPSEDFPYMFKNSLEQIGGTRRSKGNRNGGSTEKLTS